MSAVAADVRALVAGLREPPDSDDTELNLDSLALIELVEAVEERFGLRVAARDVVPENWDNVARITAYVTARLEGLS